MEVYNYRTPRWPTYQGKRKRNWDNRYQCREKPNQGEDGRHIPMEIDGHYTNRSRYMAVGNLRASAKFRGSLSKRGRNSFNEQRRPPWDYRKNSPTIPGGKRCRKDFMQDEDVNQDCMQIDDVDQDYGHYKNRCTRPRYKEEGKASFFSGSCHHEDLVMADSQAEHMVDAEQSAQVLSNDRNLKVYESILGRLTAMRRYEGSEGSDTKSSVSKKSFQTWRGFHRDADCESMDIDFQYVDTDLTTKLNEIQEKLGCLDVFTEDDISMQCTQSFSNLFL
ncbi:hypothetical protein SUGI_0047550 [Cryptomeria japonica]|nr:hypothetical protein SUGI_0047550 [Cryptomeria japonica]